MRVRKGSARRRAKKRLFKEVAGYRGGRGNMLRTAKEAIVRARAFAFRDRRTRKREFRRLWITRINAACRQRDISYSRFIHGLSQAGVEVDRKMMADMAVHDPAAFDELVGAARAQLEPKAPSSE